MIVALLNWLAGLCRASFMIPTPDGKDYLHRFAIAGDLPGEKATRRRNFFLHRIIRSDEDRHLHNHPWEWSFSLILWGGYTEERLVEWRRGEAEVKRRRMWPGRINYFGPGDFHRIVELHGKQTWTLFIGGRKLRDWGFLVPGWGFVPEQMYRPRQGARLYQTLRQLFEAGHLRIPELKFDAKEWAA